MLDADVNNTPALLLVGRAGAARFRFAGYIQVPAQLSLPYKTYETLSPIPLPPSRCLAIPLSRHPAVAPSPAHHSDP